MDVLSEAPGAHSALGRVGAGTKLVLLAVLSVVFLLSADWVTSGTGLLLLVVLTSATGLNPARIAVRLWPVLTAALLGGWATALLAEKAGETVADLGVTVLTTGSLEAGAAIALRSGALALASVLLLLTTDASEIGQALAQTFRLPARFVLAAVAALRLVGVMVVEWGTLASARRARGLGGAGGSSGLRGLAGACADFGPRTFALVVQALRRASRLSTTMEARGFGSGPRTWLVRPRYGRADLVALVVGLAVPAVAVAASVLSGQHRLIFGG
ncbi:energy-coupling factor transporter transmembrane component T family protein [Rothia halotolerans]|uniref:energy-coupling factor transporter transmembrane component T family protein n=1 Tax=Rothia halotolerans TaxID=405770 RepID=UPI00101D02F0|nr:energy-coupling factor transporter transmembrane component T [Rothia halotolerans]